MGFDCTLHAIDEKQISKLFVDVLLSGVPPAVGSAGDVGLSEDMWKATFKSLIEDEPNVAASTVCQLALVFAAKKRPYHYERGFALCLWPELEDGLAAELPKNLTASPESLFGKLVSAHPRLKAEFPIVFDGNYSTGTFIPGKNVGRALQWVEKTVKKFDEGDRDLFRGLILVLQHCAKNKFAYWEGTDLPVPMATIKVEGNETRRAERCFKWPKNGHQPIAERGDLLVCEDQLGPCKKDARTALADFSVWPPHIDWLPEFAIGAAFSKDGKMVTLASEPGSVDYRPKLRNKPGNNEDVTILNVPKAIRVGGTGFDWVDFWDGTVASLISFDMRVTGKRYPLFQNGDHLAEDKSFRPPSDNHKDYGGPDKPQAGIARTGNGTEVFLWFDSGFERVAGKFQKTFQLEPGPYWAFRAETVPGKADGFFYLTRCQLFEAIRRQGPVKHLPKITNFRGIQPGPEGSILLMEGDNKAGDWGKAYWPDSKQFIRLKAALIPEIPKRDLRAIYWLESKRRLLFFADKEVWFVPWEEIETLPRSRA